MVELFRMHDHLPEHRGGSKVPPARAAALACRRQRSLRHVALYSDLVRKNGMIDMFAQASNNF